MFENLFKLYLSKYTFKQIHIINASNPVTLITNRQTHVYSTRQAKNLHRDYARTQKIKNSFIFGGPQL